MTRKRLPWLAVLIPAAFFIFSLYLPGAGTGPDLAAFGRLPVLHNGRIKPLDTIARTSLLMIRGKQTLRESGRSLSALEWLLDLMAKPAQADAYKIFRIDDPDLGGMLGIAPSADKYHSFNELNRSMREIQAQAQASEAVEARLRSRFQSAVVNLGQRLDLYERLKNSLGVSENPDFPREIENYESALGPGVRAVLDAHKSFPSAANSKALRVIGGFFARYRLLAQAAYFKAFPPAPGENVDAWRNVGETLLEALREGQIRPELKSYAGAMRAWRDSDVPEFNRRVSDCLRIMQERAPQAVETASYEQRFNRAEPFYQGIILYLGALLLGCMSWLVRPKELGRAAFYLLATAFAVHTVGLVSRMILQGRPPVTNLYSSAIFVGWVAVGLGLILERLHRKGIAQAVSAAVGFLTLIIAHHLAAGGDTLEMMQAVLDSNFWLATHVVAITIGYGSTFLAGTLGIIYILRGYFARSLSKETTKSLVQMTYGIVCFALLFSFVGTVLGGIWADQSWGRFWGWDPKENGALMIVLWNAAILHARWGGYIRERGLMLMAVGGNIFTSLSWFGVNMLGIGLHSYGWTDKAFFWLAAFICSQLAVIALGAAPPRAKPA